MSPPEPPPEPPRPPLPREPVERAVDFRLDDLRLDEPVDLDVRVALAAPVDAEPDALLRAEPDFEVVDLVAPAERVLEPVAADLVPADRPAVERALAERLEDPLERPPSSSLQLPLITRCAASATASAISDPSRVALDIAVLAALDAASAASRPASRILRRAAGLALIAAAAAARPAASISRLMAALVILSTVVSVDEEPEEFFLFDFAIAGPPSVSGKDNPDA